MIFFTRELFLGSQDNSGWTRRAGREWAHRRDIYDRYVDVIAPMLPASVRRLCDHGLHDAVVTEASLRGTELVLLLDLAGSLSGFRARRIRLTFRGVRGRPAVSKLIGQWWLCEEAHLCSRAKFNLQVLFDPSDLEVEADELVIELFPRRRAPKSLQQTTPHVRDA